MPLKNTTLTLQLTGGHTNTAGAIPLAYVLNGTFELPATMTDGTGSNKAQTSAKVSDSVANGAPDTVDLTAVSRSPLANAVFSKLKIGIIVNKETTTGKNIRLKPGASNGFASFVTDPSDEVKIPPSAFYIFVLNPVDGETVDGTHKNIQISSDSGTSAYELWLVGEGT
jgi:hypothetical protein